MSIVKKKFIIISSFLVIISIFIYFYYVKNNKEINSDYVVFAIQTGAYKDYNKAMLESKKIKPSSVIYEDNYYKVYSAIYKNLDLLNEMVVYLEDNDTDVYLKNIYVSEEFYRKLDNYERVILNSSDDMLEKVNKLILDEYEKMVSNV